MRTMLFILDHRLQFRHFWVVRTWTLRCAWFRLCGLIIFLHLLPYELSAHHLAMSLVAHSLTSVQNCGFHWLISCLSSLSGISHSWVELHVTHSLFVWLRFRQDILIIIAICSQLHSRWHRSLLGIIFWTHILCSLTFHRILFFSIKHYFPLNKSKRHKSLWTVSGCSRRWFL
jgi:hypothetical protein